MVRLTFLMILVSGAQLWMFYRQWRVMHHSLGDTKVAAEAALANATAAQKQAEIAERTLTNLEQPNMFVMDLRAIESRDDTYITSFTIKNLGRSPAIVREVQCWFSLEGFVPEPPFQPPETYSGWDIFRVLGPQEESKKFTPKIDGDFGLATKTINGSVYVVPTVPENKWFFMVVRIIYDNVFGQEFMSGFCWFLDGGRGIFIRPDDISYFRKQQRQGDQKSG